MYRTAELYLFRCVTPLHPGAGFVLEGGVDLPIQREARTGWPKVDASGIKGALRAAASSKMNDKELIEALFGSEPGEKEPKPGALGITDARILFLPVRSLKGGWALVSSAQVLREFKDMMEAFGVNLELDLVALSPLRNKAIAFGDTLTVEKNGGRFVILEEYEIEAKLGDLSQLPDWLGIEKERVVILDDESFNFFVQAYTEVTPHVQLGEDGTVESGPWFEERLPRETVMYFFALAQERYPKEIIEKPEEALKKLSEFVDAIRYIQIGGNRTLGEGLVELWRVKDEKSNQK